MGKDQKVTDYFIHVMWLCKLLDPNMPDNLRWKWVAKWLPPTFRDVMFYCLLDASMLQLEEHFKVRESFLATTGEKTQEVCKDTKVKAGHPLKASNTKGEQASQR